LILGFAHLALNTADLAAVERDCLAQGYARTALHEAVPNHAGKAQFTHTLQAPATHTLMLLRGPGLWPLELTCHSATMGHNTQIRSHKELIELHVPEVQALQALLTQGLGFELDDAAQPQILRLNSRLPGWSCRVKLVPAQTAPVRLDAEGASCLAFYSNRLEEDLARLMALGAQDSTGAFRLQLAGRDMNIALVRAPGGVLIELIHPQTRPL